MATTRIHSGPRSAAGCNGQMGLDADPTCQPSRPGRPGQAARRGARPTRSSRAERVRRRDDRWLEGGSRVASPAARVVSRHGEGAGQGFKVRSSPG
jgi:hypothetical protein